jgi:hypothetical protein
VGRLICIFTVRVPGLANRTVDEMLELSIFEKLLRIGIESVPCAPSFTGHVEWGGDGVLFLAHGGFGNVILGEKSATHF